MKRLLTLSGCCRGAQWLALCLTAKKDTVQIPEGTFLCGVQIFYSCVHGFFPDNFGFHPQSKDMLHGLIDFSELSLGV